MMTKENSGKAARRKFFQRLWTILLIFAVTLFGLFLSGVGQGNNNKPQIRRIQATTLEKIHTIEKAAKKLTHSEHNNPLLTQKHHKKGEIIKVNVKDPNQVKPLLDAEVHLISISVDRDEMNEASENTYQGITAEFCKLDFAIQKKDPSSVPMFRFLVDASSGCQTGVHYHVDLKEFVTLARSHDSTVRRDVKALPVGGVVFHESRCGSTLVANALSAMNPTQTRVYSESAPPIAALHMVCGETYTSCSLEQAAQVLSDTVYAMSRTRDFREQHVFFKIQSLGTRNIPVFQAAFPDVPWIFVYRDPVQVMMSQLKGGTKYANCVRPRQQKNVLVSDLVRRHGRKVSELSDVEYCAAHLASLTEAAVDALQTEPRRGKPVNYDTLPDALFEDIIPNHFGINLSSEEINNIRQISSVYSKGAGGRQGEFKSDSAKKEKMASQEIRDASKLFLDESFQTLQQQQDGILVDKEVEGGNESENETDGDEGKRGEETDGEEEEEEKSNETDENDKKDDEEGDDKKDDEEEEEKKEGND